MSPLVGGVRVWRLPFCLVSLRAPQPSTSQAPCQSEAMPSSRCLLVLFLRVSLREPDDGVAQKYILVKHLSQNRSGYAVVMCNSTIEKRSRRIARGRQWSQSGLAYASTARPCGIRNDRASPMIGCGTPPWKASSRTRQSVRSSTFRAPAAQAKMQLRRSSSRRTAACDPHVQRDGGVGEVDGQLLFSVPVGNGRSARLEDQHAAHPSRSV